MADLTARIKPKKSSTAGEVPQASDLEISELAVNTADGKLFTKHTDNSIKEISGVSELEGLTDVGAAGQSGILMDFDGGNGSTTFTESTGKITSWSVFSTAQQSTAQVKYGVSSFEGSKGGARYIQSNNLIGTDAEAEFAIGTGDFTFEVWAFIPTGATTAFQDVFAIESADGADEVMRMAIGKSAASGSVDDFIFSVGTGSSGATSIVNLQNQALYSYDTWHHLAVSRSGSTLKAFVDGTEIASVSDSTNIGSVLGANLHMHIGRNVPGTGQYLDSYLDNLYIIKGTAKYTAAFTSGQAIASPIPASDGQVLTYVAANNQWEPATPAVTDAASARTLLGIGEYADDAAAGTGGVASGAMYYNTTSSDYRLKS